MGGRPVPYTIRLQKHGRYVTIHRAWCGYIRREEHRDSMDHDTLREALLHARALGKPLRLCQALGCFRGIRTEEELLAVGESVER